MTRKPFEVQVRQDLREWMIEEARSLGPDRVGGLAENLFRAIKAGHLPGLKLDVRMPQ